MMGKDLCIINLIGRSVKIYSLIDKLVKMHVLKIFITGDIFVLLVLLALLMSPEIGQNSCLRHAIGNYFELNYSNYLL